MPSSEDLKELNSRLNEMRDDGLEATRDWTNIWRDGLNYHFGHQLADKKIPDGWEPLICDYIFPSMMQELAIQSQRSSTILVKPWEQTDAATAEVWQSHFKWLYERAFKMNMFNMRASLDGKIYGHYIAYTYWEQRDYWDPQNEEWVGAPKIRLIKPEYFGVDPEAESANNNEPGYVYTRRWIARDEAKWRWPHMEKAIDEAPEEDQISQGIVAPIGAKYQWSDGTDEGVSGNTMGRLANLLHGRKTYSRGTDRPGAKPRYITVEQYWFHDYEERQRTIAERVSEEELEADGLIKRDEANGGIWRDSKTGRAMTLDAWPTRDPVVKKSPAYPNGRFVMRIGDEIIQPDPAKQAWPYQRWPFVVGINQMLPHRWNGLNNVESSKQLQDWVNVIGMHIGNTLKIYGAPITIVEEGAKAPGSKFKTAAGAIWNVVRGGINKVRREPPVAMQSGSIEGYRMLVQELQNNTGVQDVGMGRAARGKPTATEIIRLETNTKLRMALGNAFQDDFTVAVFENIAGICRRMYSPEQMIRIVGEEHADTVAQITSGMKDIRFDIDLEIGTSLPFDRERKKEEALKLFQAIGPAMMPELLKDFERKDAEEILARAPMWQAFEQFMAQQEEAQKAQQQESQKAGPQ